MQKVTTSLTDIISTTLNELLFISRSTVTSLIMEKDCAVVYHHVSIK